MKRLLTWVLTLMMIFTMLPGMTLAAFAAETVSSGDCGDNLTWTLDADGLLTISGMGEKIKDNAFLHRTDIVSVTIPNGVTSIGISAFESCTGLTSVTIPDSVTSIGNYAFYGCTGLTSATIGNGVTSIGIYAFYRCTSLTSATIGNGVTSIGSSAFYNTGLTSVTIGKSVTSIGNSAFRSCASLTGVTIPDSVTSIGSSAFEGCTGLTSVTMGNGVKSIGEYAFYGCGLTSVTMGNGVTSIGNYAFYGCTGLTGVTIPDSVTSIGNFAFNGCQGLTSVTIGKSVTSIGNNAFYGCNAVKSVSIPCSLIGEASLNVFDENIITVREHFVSEAGGTCSKCNRNCGTDFAHDFDENKKCSICGFACGTESNPHDWSNKDGICAVCSCECPGHEYDENNTCETCGMKSEIVINMTDSYGDGWGGSAIEIYKDGELVDTATVLNGYSATGRTDYDPHSTYTFKWVKGNFVSECSFEILIEGQSVFSVVAGGCSNYDNEAIFFTLAGKPYEAFEILSGEASGDQWTAKVAFPEAGTYTVIFVDYGAHNSLNQKEAVTLKVDEAGAYTVTTENGITLDAGDKIMVWSDNFLETMVPMCKPYILN